MTVSLLEFFKLFHIIPKFHIHLHICLFLSFIMDQLCYYFVPFIHYEPTLVLFCSFHSRVTTWRWPTTPSTSPPRVCPWLWRSTWWSISLSMLRVAPPSAGNSSWWSWPGSRHCTSEHPTTQSSHSPGMELLAEDNYYKKRITIL